MKRTGSKALQFQSKIDNIGYLIPSCVVEAFLARCSTTADNEPFDKHTLSPSIPYHWHSLENQSLRLAHQVPDNIHGVLITSVCETLLQGLLQKGDILTMIDDKPVADDGQVTLRPGELIQHVYLLRVKKVNEPVVFSVYRNGQHVRCSPEQGFVLQDIPSIVLRWPNVDLQPDYLILGALVLLPLSWPLRLHKKCGTRVIADCIDWCQKWPHEWEGKEGLVILTDIFAHELSFSYRRPWRRVVTYNGQAVQSLAHLRDLWESSCDQVRQHRQEQEKDPNQEETTATPRWFARIGLENDDDVVFEVQAAMNAQEEILTTHQIPNVSRILPRNPKYDWSKF